jgi:ABC-type phosphate transport system permease subunit
LIFIALYLLACLMCAFMGRHTNAGFMGHFVLSLLVTPLVSFAAQAACRAPKSMREKKSACRDSPPPDLSAASRPHSR